MKTLQIPQQVSNFTGQKHGIMKDKNYTRFATLLESGEFDSYEAICRRLKVCPDDLDEALMAELGYTGEQVFDYYFGNRC